MRVLFLGITQFAVKGLKHLINKGYTPVGVVVIALANQDITNIRQICTNQNIPVYCFNDINNEQFIEIVQNELKPDLLLAFTFSQKLKPALYNLAKYAINMHPSYLPNYRGNNPYFWTISNGETATGVSFHFLNENFDEGDIIAQEEVPILPDDTCGQVIARQEPVALKLLDSILDKCARQEVLPRMEQVAGTFKKSPKPTVKDLFIHWEKNSKEIIDRIRALNPYTGAYTQFKNVVLAIYKASITQYASAETPGTIIAFAPEGPIIKTGDSAITIKILTVGKKYLLSGNDFIEYEKVQIGDKFKTWE